MREKDEPTDEQVRTATDPTLLAGDAQMPGESVKAATIDILGGCATVRLTGWSCVWDGSERQFVAAHPKNPWLRVVGKTDAIVVERIQSVQKWARGRS